MKGIYLSVVLSLLSWSTRVSQVELAEEHRQGFIVNGHIEKNDANLLGSFTFDKIGNTN